MYNNIFLFSTKFAVVPQMKNPKLEIKPPNRIQRILNLINSFVRGLKLLFSFHFYQNFFASIYSIIQLVRNGDFIIRTKFFDKESGNKGLIYSRFQADGDILNMLPESLPESDLEALCNHLTCY